MKSPLAIYVLLCLVLAISPPAWGEIADNPAFNNVEAFREAPKAPPEDTGRKQKSNGAVVAAIIGAAVAGSMCALLMKQAMEHPPGSQERTQLMTQAAQQCAQAGQSAANAGQNDEGSKQLTSAPEGALPNFGKTAKTTAKKPRIELPSRATASNTSPTEEIDFGPDPTIPDVDLGETELVGPGFGNNLAGSGFAIDSTTTLDPIAPAKLTYDENSAGGGVTPPTNAPTAQGLLGAEINFDELNNKKVADALDAIDQNVDAVRRSGHRPTTGGAGSALRGRKGSTKASLKDLMGAFSNGANRARLASGGGFRPKVINITTKKPTKKLNIFEYASHRYKSLAHKKKRLRVAQLKVQPSAQKRNIAAKTRTR